MGKAVSDELRRLLNDPVARYRIVEAWHLINRKADLEERIARRKILAEIRAAREHPALPPNRP